MKKSILLTTLLTLCSTTFAANNSFDETKAGLQKAMKSVLRTEKDTRRDNNRKPIETLEFFGFRNNMSVIELFPGGGWYSKLLAPTLKQKGHFAMALGAGGVSKNLLDKVGFEKAEVLNTGASLKNNLNSRFYNISEFSFGVTHVDMVVTFRNYHNFDEASRQRINQQVFKALKPGGIFALVDHTRRHMQQLNNENVRRVDPVLAIKEIQAAGFKFVDFSDLHYRADDELRYEVGRKTVTGNTDRFTLKFIKPK